MKKIILGVISIFFITAKAQVVISEIFYDTPYLECLRCAPEDVGQYNLSVHHLGEFIELYNYTTEDIPLIGWSLSDRGSRFIIPNTVIKSGQFLIVAYVSDNQNAFVPFNIMFPNTTGHESQIIYQNSIMLNNFRENVRLNMGTLRGVVFRNTTVSQMAWSPTSQPHINNGINDACVNPADPNCSFYLNSLNLVGPNLFGAQTANPLSGSYLPPLQDLEDIQSVRDAILDNMAYSTWDYYVNEILNISCPANQYIVEQTPTDIYLPNGKCFNYDTSVNYYNSNDCVPPSSVNNPATEYSSQEITEIANKIQLSPNPTTTFVNISWDASIVGKITQIQVANTMGANIAIIPINPTQSSATVDLTSQPSGIYIFKFHLDTTQFVSKNVIKL